MKIWICGVLLTHALGEHLLPYNNFPGTRNVIDQKSRARREADISLGAAETECDTFYNERGEGDEGTKTKLLGEGGQSKVYKCETNAASELPKVVIKLYMRPWEVS